MTITLTRFMLRYLGILALLFIVYPASAQQSETLTNQTVVQLHKAGMGNDLIKAKIQTSTCSFDTSTDGLITLKKAGVSDEVIALMLNKGTQPMLPNATVAVDEHAREKALEPGLYYFDINANEYVELDAAVLSNIKSGGFGEAMKRSISGLFNSKQKATLSGISANLQINAARPLFVFVFDHDKTGFNDNNRADMNVESPNEFFLVQFIQGKNDREIVTGKGNDVGNNFGIDDRSKIPFTYKKLQKGLYEVSPSTGLLNGEYCFMFAASSASAQGITHKVYDFGIRK